MLSRHVRRVPEAAQGHPRRGRRRLRSARDWCEMTGDPNRFTIAYLYCCVARPGDLEILRSINKQGTTPDLQAGGFSSSPGLRTSVTSSTGALSISSQPPHSAACHLQKQQRPLLNLSAAADLIRRGVPCVFTCANDFIDGKNEPLVMRAALRAKVVLAPRACPFRAVSTFHAPGASGYTLRVRGL